MFHVFCLIIHYNQLAEKPADTIKKVYQFLKLPLWEHRFIDLDPFNIQGLYYNDKVLSSPLHSIKVDKIKKIDYSFDNSTSKDVKQEPRNQTPFR